MLTKRKARVIADQAVRNNVIIKPDVCSVCNKNTKLQKHHPDYFKPLELVWVCIKCHRKIHSETGYQKNIDAGYGENKDVLTFKIPLDLKRRFEIKCKKEDRSMSSAVRMMMKQYVGKSNA